VKAAGFLDELNFCEERPLHDAAERRRGDDFLAIWEGTSEY